MAAYFDCWIANLIKFLFVRDWNFARHALFVVVDVLTELKQVMTLVALTEETVVHHYFVMNVNILLWVVNNHHKLWISLVR